MKFNWTTIPQGWNASLKQDGCAVSSDITRTGDADRFESIDLGIDLGAALTADSAIMTGAPAMGTWMRIFAPETFGITIRAKNWMLVRIAKEDFILIAIASWHIFSGELLFRNGDVTVRFFGDGHRFASGETAPLEQLFCMRGSSERALLDAYADYLAKFHAVRLNLRSWRGWGSWDYYAIKFNDRAIRKNLDELQKLTSNANLLQIDDGYSLWGDWTNISPEVFPEGLDSIVKEAALRGLETGIWLAPFLAEADSQILKNHPDWFLRKPDGSYVPAWTGRVIFDYSNDEVVDYLRRCIRFFRNAGITYLKIDFLRAGTLSGLGKVPMSAYERFHRCLSAIREEAGDDCYILGCSAEFAPCIGHVDGMRVGPDISPKFEDVRKSAHCCMASAHLHRKVYQCDPDYLIVRGEGMEDAEVSPSGAKHSTLTHSEAELWANFVTMTGNAVLSSDKLPLLSHDRKNLVAAAFQRASENAKGYYVLDYWQEIPSMIWADGKLGVFNWSDSEQTFTLPGDTSLKLPAHASRILEKFAWDGKQIPVAKLPPLPATPTGEPFDAADALPLPLGPEGHEPLATNHETGEGLLDGAYVPVRELNTFLGVPFKIGAHIITFTMGEPRKSIRIPVGRKVRELYFLHAADFPVTGEWLSYILHAADGSVREYKLLMGRDIGNSDYHYSLPWTSQTARIAWIDPVTSRTLYVQKLVPDMQTELDFIEVTHPLQNGTHILAGISTR